MRRIRLSGWFLAFLYAAFLLWLVSDKEQISQCKFLSTLYRDIDSGAASTEILERIERFHPSIKYCFEEIFCIKATLLAEFDRYDEAKETIALIEKAAMSQQHYDLATVAKINVLALSGRFEEAADLYIRQRLSLEYGSNLLRFPNILLESDKADIKKFLDDLGPLLTNMESKAISLDDPVRAFQIIEETSPITGNRHDLFQLGEKILSDSPRRENRLQGAEIGYSLANFALYEGKIDLAEHYLSTALDWESEGWPGEDAALSLSAIHFDRNRFTEAFQLLDRIKNSTVERIRLTANLRLAFLNLSVGNRTDAIATLAALLRELESKSASASASMDSRPFELVCSLEGIKSELESIPLSGNDPALVERLRILADRFGRKGYAEIFWWESKRIPDKFGNDRVKLAEYLFRQKCLAKAVRSDAAFLLGTEARKNFDQAMAIAWFAKTIELDDRSLIAASSEMIIGDIHAEGKKFDMAELFYEKAASTKAGDTSAFALFKLAESKINTASPVDAALLLKTASRRLNEGKNEKWRKRVEYLAIVLTKQRKAMIAYLEALQKDDPDFALKRLFSLLRNADFVSVEESDTIAKAVNAAENILSDKDSEPGLAQEACYYLADQARRSSERNSQMEYLSACIEFDETSWIGQEAHLALGEFALDRSEFDNAEAHFKKVIGTADSRRAIRASFSLVDLLTASGRKDEAQRIIEDLSKRVSAATLDDRDLPLFGVLQYQINHDDEERVEYLLRLLLSDGRANDLLLKELWKSALRLKRQQTVNYDRSIKFLIAHPETPDWLKAQVLVDYGRHLIEKGLAIEGKKYLLDCLRKFPNTATTALAYLYLGQQEFKEGQLDQADFYYSQAMVGPDLTTITEAAFAMAEIRMANRKNDSAMDLYDAVIEAATSQADAHYLAERAMFLKSSAAKSIVDRATALIAKLSTTNDSWFYLDLATAILPKIRDENQTLANRVADEIIANKDSKDWMLIKALYIKAKIVLQRGNSDGAKKLYEEAIEKFPDTWLFFEAYKELAIIEYHQGNPEEALKKLSIALQAPNAEIAFWACFERTKILIALGRRDEAREQIERLLVLLRQHPELTKLQNKIIELKKSLVKIDD